MCKILLLASVSLALLGASPVHAATVSTTKPIYAWKTETEKDPQSGRFNHCLIQNMYDNGTLVTFAENNDGLQRLALSFPQNKLKAGQHADLTLQIDSRDVFPVEAVAASAQILTIGLPDGLLDEMRKGRDLHLRGPNDEVTYGLGAIDGAVDALRDCLVTQKNRGDTNLQVADAPAPVVVPPAEAVKPAPLKSPFNAPAENPPAPPVTQTRNTLPAPFDALVAAADLGPVQLMPVDVARHSREADYAWKKDAVTIAIAQLPISGDNVFAEDNVAYLAKLKARCDGQFIAEASPAIPVANDKPAYQLVETACSGKAGDTITAVLFAALPKGTAVFSVQAKADQGGNAIKARDALAKAVLR